MINDGFKAKPSYEFHSSNHKGYKHAAWRYNFRRHYRDGRPTAPILSHVIVNLAQSKGTAQYGRSPLDLWRLAFPIQAKFRKMVAS